MAFSLEKLNFYVSEQVIINGTISDTTVTQVTDGTNVFNVTLNTDTNLGEFQINYGYLTLSDSPYEVNLLAVDGTHAGQPVETFTLTIEADPINATVKIVPNAYYADEGSDVIIDIELINQADGLPVAVTGSDVIVTLDNGAVATIPVGDTAGQAIFSTVEDVYVNSGSVTITNVQGGEFGKIDIDPSVINYAIHDSIDSVVVTLEDAVINEGSSSTTIVANISEAPKSDLTLTLSTGGVVVIAAGTTSGESNPFSIKPGIFQDGQQFSVSIVGVQCEDTYENLVTTNTSLVTVRVGDLNAPTALPVIDESEVVYKDFDPTGEIEEAKFDNDGIINDYSPFVATNLDQVKNTSVAGAEITYGPIETDAERWPARRNIQDSIDPGYFTANMTDAEDEQSDAERNVKRKIGSAGFDTSGFTF